jgi:D-alanyl-D-alanine carboxypeptidase (penicillin-binding protein 5/6)
MRPWGRPPAALLRSAAAAALALALLVAGSNAAAQKGDPEGAKNGNPAKAKPEGPPKLDARAWILIDPLDGEVLAAHGPDRELPIASTTKLMTAHLALKRLRTNQRLRAPAYDALAAESVLGLAAGEKLRVRDLLYALLLPSANDAAATIAVGVAGSEKRFVAEMNRAAASLGLEHTHYANPIGLDEAGNYSSARDLVTLAADLLSSRLFARIVDTPEAVLRSGSAKRRVTTRNTLLLSDPTVVGVKTGHTIEAGYVLVGAARRNGTTLLSALLGAGSEAARDAETEKLLDYGFSQYRSRQPVTRGEELANPKLDYRSDRVALVARRDVRTSIRKGQRVRSRVIAPQEVEGPIEKGEVLGRVVVTVDGRVAGGSPLVAASSAPAASLVQKAIAAVAQPLALIPAGLLVMIVGLVLAVRRRGEDDPEPEGPPAGAPDFAGAPGPAGPPTEPPPPKKPRLRRERKPKGPRARTPEERRQMAEERARRRHRGRGR